MKKLLTILISLFTCFTGALPNNIVYAEDTSSLSCEESYTWIIPLDQEYYENTIYDKNGEPVTLTVSDIPSITRVSNGAKLITHSSLDLNMSFVINISNNQITNAYNAKYSSSFTVLNSSLFYESDLATMSIVLSYLYSTSSHSLTASIKSKKLYTTFQ